MTDPRQFFNTSIYETPTQEELQTIADRYQYISAHEQALDAAAKQQLKAANPQVQIVHYLPTISTAIQPTNPDTYIKDASGDPVNQLNNTIPYMLDPAHPEVQDHVVAQALSYKAAGYDGVMVDELCMARDLPQDFQGINPRTGDIYTTEDFRAAQLEILTAVRQAWPEGKVVANSIGNGQSYFNYAPYDFVEQADVLVAEGYRGGLYWTLDQFMTEDQWLKTVHMNEDLAERSAGLLANAEFHASILTDEAKKDAYDLFLYTTFLMGYQPNTDSSFAIITQTSDPVTVTTVWHDYYETSPGDPLGPPRLYRTTPTNIYTREYTNAYVIVNPTDVPFERLQLPREYHTPSGKVVTSVTLNPHSGKILFK